jgi:hypothetical protein
MQERFSFSHHSAQWLQLRTRALYIACFYDKSKMCTIDTECQLFSAADATQLPPSQQNGHKAHDEKIDSIAQNGRDRAFIGVMILLRKGTRLAGGKEEPTRFIGTPVLAGRFNALCHGGELSVGEIELCRLIMRGRGAFLLQGNYTLKEFLIVAHGGFGNTTQDFLSLVNIGCKTVEYKRSPLNETQLFKGAALFVFFA